MWGLSRWGNAKGTQCPTVMKHSKGETTGKYGTAVCLFFLANPTRTSVFVPCTVQNNFSTVLIGSHGAPQFLVGKLRVYSGKESIHVF